MQLSWFGPSQKQRATQLLYCPSPLWGGDENGKKKAEKKVRIKGSLIEQQTKRTVTTIILIRRIYKANSSMHRAALTKQCPACSQAMTIFPLVSSPPHSKPSMTAHGMKYSVCLANLSRQSRLCHLLASSEI